MSGAEHGADSAPSVLGLTLVLGIGVEAELEVDAPDVVGLHVQQRRALRVEGRIEPEAALGREIGLHDDVGDQEVLFEGLAREAEAEASAHGAVCAVGGNQIVALEGVRPVGRVDLEPDVIVGRHHGGHAVQPAQLGQLQLVQALDQELLGVVLLQVDEGGHLVTAFR